MLLREKSGQYLAQLDKMCKTVSSSHIVRRKSHGLRDGAQQLLDQLRTYKDNQGVYSLKLNPNWNVELEAPNICGAPGRTELQFGGEIIFKDECLERQVLAVVILFRSNNDHPATNGRPRLVANEYHVIRRFHFDFDRTVHEGDTPLSHLQVGGQLNQAYLSIPEGTQCRYEQFDQLDGPRLPWAIAGLPVVLDTFLRQFPSGLDEFLVGTAWRRHVMDSERLWLMDFFQQASEMMGGENARQTLYEYCCGKSAFDQS